MTRDSRSTWLTFRAWCESGRCFSVKARSYDEAYRKAVRIMPVRIG